MNGCHRPARNAIGVALLACSVAAGCGIAATRLPIAWSAIAVLPASAATTVDPETMAGKLLFGYQGCFGCPGDGSPLRAWEHWFRRGDAPSGASVRVDMWPDVSELWPGWGWGVR